MFNPALFYRLSLAALLALFVALPGCGGGESEAETESVSESGTQAIELEPIAQDVLDSSQTHTYPDGTSFRYPEHHEINPLVHNVAIGARQSANHATIYQFPANGETLPGTPWILDRHDEIFASDRHLNEPAWRSDLDVVRNPAGTTFIHFTCKGLFDRSPELESQHYITIINDRVYVIFSFGEVRNDYGLDVELGEFIAATIRPGTAPDEPFINDDPGLVGTYSGVHLNNVREPHSPMNHCDYSLHPDGKLVIGQRTQLTQVAGADEQIVLFDAPAGSQDLIEIGRWSAQDGVLTLTWDNRRRSIEYNLRERFVLYLYDAGHGSNRPLEMRCITAHDLASAPILEVVEEEQTDASPTSVTDTPETTNPTPTLNTRIPTAPAIDFAGNGGTSPFSEREQEEE